MDHPVVRAGPAGVYGLLQGVQNETGRGRFAGPPADDPSREGVDHERNIDEPRPSVDVSKVDHPQRVRAQDRERAVDLVERARRLGIADHRKCPLSAPYACRPDPLPQPLDGALGRFDTGAPQLVPDLAGAIKGKAGRMHPPDLRLDLAMSAATFALNTGLWFQRVRRVN